MRTTLLGSFFLLTALGLVLGVLYYNSVDRHVPVVFSSHEMLHSLWDTYKVNNLEPSTGRTIDKNRNNITTSEGEAYTMLRAVWVDDKNTFDRSWKWTKDNLGHSGDPLFSWLFGARADGSYGVLSSEGGAHSASDADTDIALSLLFAYDRWHDDAYLSSARTLMNGIWNEEVVEVAGRPYLAANNVEHNSSSTILVNPSYLAPYAYREFARVDASHRWNTLVDSSYELLARSMTLPLGSSRSAGLPPDWIELDRTTGSVHAPSAASLSTQFGYDALRVPWRVALDYMWNKDSRAHDILARFSTLATEWKSSSKLAAVHSHDGKIISAAESPALYGATLAYFEIADPAAAGDLYKTKLQILYDPDKRSWKSPLSYYDDNWVWFGMAYHWDELPDLARPTGTPTAAVSAR